jgi:hypothetical protein
MFMAQLVKKFPTISESVRFTKYDYCQGDQIKQEELGWS